MENETWYCDVCGNERADRYISVLTYPIKDIPGAERNLKYCNDDVTCIAQAEIEAETGKI